MKIALLTLCRDRVEYTRSCFDSLRANAGIGYDHFVLDQGSRDGTWNYLQSIPLKARIRLEENIGLCPGLNRLLDAGAAEGYDVVVRYDNDCEVLEPDTLRSVAGLAFDHDLILAPRVLGLKHPPPTISEFDVDGHRILETTILGGIFMAIPAALFTRDGFRYDEDNPPWAGDEKICDWYRDRGGRCGYVVEFGVNHVDTTHGQLARSPSLLHAASCRENEIRGAGPAHETKERAQTCHPSHSAGRAAERPPGSVLSAGVRWGWGEAAKEPQRALNALRRRPVAAQKGGAPRRIPARGCLAARQLVLGCEAPRRHH